MNIPVRPTISPQAVEARKQRWLDFFAPDAAPGFMFYVNYNDPDADLPEGVKCWPENQEKLVEHRWAHYLHALEKAACIDDDFVPNVNMMTGTEIFAEAFGCEVVRPEDTNPFAQPLIHSVSELDQVRVPELSCSSLAWHFEMGDELQRRAGDDAVFHLVDVQSPMDIAALILEKGAFFMALLEEPAAVREIAARVQELLIAFFDEWFKRYGRDYVAHFPSYFMRGGLTLSEDEVGAVNAEAFDEYFLPELNALSDHFGGLGMHCCADARHQWAGFKKINGLRLLNLCRPPTRTQDYVTEAYAYFVDHCVQWHMGWEPSGPIATWPEQMPAGSRFVVTANAETKDEAIALCAQLNEVRAGL